MCRAFGGRTPCSGSGAVPAVSSKDGLLAQTIRRSTRVRNPAFEMGDVPCAWCAGLCDQHRVFPRASGIRRITDSGVHPSWPAVPPRRATTVSTPGTPRYRLGRSSRRRTGAMRNARARVTETMGSAAWRWGSRYRAQKTSVPGSPSPARGDGGQEVDGPPCIRSVRAGGDPVRARGQPIVTPREPSIQSVRAMRCWILADHGRPSPATVAHGSRA